MNREHVEEKKELVHALGKDRKLSELPKIPQVNFLLSSLTPLHSFSPILCTISYCSQQ